LQNSTNSENILTGWYGETYPASHDANQALDINAEEVSVGRDEADPMRITIHEIEAEPGVSCMFLYVHCYVDVTNMDKCQFYFSSRSVLLSFCLCICNNCGVLLTGLRSPSSEISVDSSSLLNIAVI
jgi:hypothetical protein